MQSGVSRFEGVVIFALSDGELRVDLQVTNRRCHPLPVGLGLHPWLPRTAGTTLLARAKVVTLEDIRHLPENRVPVSSRGDWHFTTHRRLRAAWINNDFSPLGRTRRDHLA